MQKLASLQLACKFLSCMGRSSQLPSIFTASPYAPDAFAPRSSSHAPAALAPPSSSHAPTVSSVSPSFKKLGSEASSNLEVSPLKRFKETEQPERQEPKPEPKSRAGIQRSSQLLTLTRRQSDGVIQSLRPELEARESREEEMMETVKRIAKDGQEYR